MTLPPLPLEGNLLNEHREALKPAKLPGDIPRLEAYLKGEDTMQSTVQENIQASKVIKAVTPLYYLQRLEGAEWKTILRGRSKFTVEQGTRLVRFPYPDRVPYDWQQKLENLSSCGLVTVEYYVTTK